MAFCGGRLGAETAELWCGGRNPLRRELASTLTSRSVEILPLFFNFERHVSGGVPIRAHFLFMYSWFSLYQGYGRVQKRESALYFYAWDTVPRDPGKSASGSGAWRQDM